jgi:hypothetical protein
MKIPYLRIIAFSLFMSLLCICVLFTSAETYRGDRISLINNPSELETFIDIHKKSLKNGLKGKRIVSNFHLENDFSESNCLRKLVGDVKMPIIKAFSKVTEEISKTGLIKIDLTNETHYAQTTDAQDIADKDSYHIQSGRGIYYITPGHIAKLASPDAVDQKIYPQWLIRENDSTMSPTENIMFILSNPYSEIEQLIKFHKFEQTTYSIDVDKKHTTLTIELGNALLFKGVFHPDDSGKWSSLAFYNHSGNLSKYYKADYNIDGVIEKFEKFVFFRGCEYKGAISYSQLKDNTDTYLMADVLEYVDADNPDDYFNAYKQMESHHTVVDKIKDQYYKVSEPEKMVKYSSLNLPRMNFE